MTLKVVHAAMRRILDNRAPVEGYTLCLFANNIVGGFSRDTILTDLVENTFDGYVRQNPTWIAAFQNGVEEVATAGACVFTAANPLSFPEDCYGYFFLDNLGNLAWGESFPNGKVTIAVPDQTLTIYPQLKLKNYGEF